MIGRKFMGFDRAKGIYRGMRQASVHFHTREGG